MTDNGKKNGSKTVRWVIGICVVVLLALFQLLRASDIDRLRDSTKAVADSLEKNTNHDTVQDSSIARLNTQFALDRFEQKSVNRVTIKSLEVIMDELNIPQWKRPAVDTAGTLSVTNP